VRPSQLPATSSGGAGAPDSCTEAVLGWLRSSGRGWVVVVWLGKKEFAAVTTFSGGGRPWSSGSSVLHARWTSSVSFRGEALKKVEEAPRSTGLRFCYQGGQIGGSHARREWLVHDPARGVRRRESDRMGASHRARGRAETPRGVTRSTTT
jgi:hypothetical protein